MPAPELNPATTNKDLRNIKFLLVVVVVCTGKVERRAKTKRLAWIAATPVLENRAPVK
jgi:hypothetical protein